MQYINDGFNYFLSTIRALSDALTITELADGTAPVDGNIVLDNLHAGDSWNEEALFHLFNRTADGAASVLITSETRVAGMGWSLPDLSSRMRALSVATLDAPDDALLRSLLEKYFADRQLAVATQVLDYMVSRMERSFVAVQTIAAAMDRRSLAERRNLTLPLAREIMTEFADGDHARQPALPTGPGTTGPEPEED
ncbi:MAG: hypothetical protein VX386_07290 [Pseudomonadota bacterium]|nr:hypothetical protein [Pseudomonadota bacterium]